MSKIIQFKTSSKEKVYPNPYWPIGSIYLSVTNTNPSQWFGGKWEQIAKGRTLVGVDTSQSEFNTVKKTGGNKNLQQHKHGFYYDGGASGSGGDWAIQLHWGIKGNLTQGSAQAGVDNAGTGDSGNLQPYYTCYIWCRTA